MALIRNKLWHYNEVILTKDGGRRFTELYQEANHLADAVCDQVGIYHSTSLATVVLQDSQSQDWDDPRAWHEGERLSCCVQLWWFSIQAARHSLFSSLPPTAASAILARLLNDSLSLFAHRYSNLSPTIARLAQYRCDLLAILLGTAQILPSVSPNLASLLHPASHTKLPAIHTKAESLMATLVMVTAPASALAAELNSNPKSGRLPALGPCPLQPETWTSLLCPGSSWSAKKQPRTKDEKLQRVSLLVKLTSQQAHPAWGLQVQMCLSSEALLPASLLTQMGAFVPPNPGSDQTQATCGLSSCSGPCLGPAGPLWPVQVSAATFFIAISISGAGCSRGFTTTCSALLSSRSACQIFFSSSCSPFSTLVGLSPSLIALEPASPCLAPSPLSSDRALDSTCSGWLAQGRGGGKDLDPGTLGESPQAAGHRAC